MAKPTNKLTEKQLGDYKFPSFDLLNDYEDLDLETNEQKGPNNKHNIVSLSSVLSSKE